MGNGGAERGARLPADTTCKFQRLMGIPSPQRGSASSAGSGSIALLPGSKIVVKEVREFRPLEAMLSTVQVVLHIPFKSSIVSKMAVVRLHRPQAGRFQSSDRGLAQFPPRSLIASSSTRFGKI